MTNFLQEVFAQGKARKSSSNDRIESLKKEIVKLKKDLKSTLKKKYVDSNLLLNPNKILVDESDKLLSDIQNLQDVIDEQVYSKLLVSSRELQKLSQELKEHNYSLKITSRILDIQNCFESLNKLQEQKHHSMIAETFFKLNTLLVDDSVDSIQHLEIYPSMKKEYRRQFDAFVLDLSTSWHKLLQFQEVPFVMLNAESETELRDVVNAFHDIDKLDENVEILARKVLNLFVLPIVQRKCEIEKGPRSLTLKIVPINDVPSFSSVLSNLQLLFEFLKNHLNFEVGGQHFMTKLSLCMFEDFEKFLINECIVHVIPSSKSELVDFQDTGRKIEDFREFLVKIGFLSQEKMFLSKYTTNVDDLYINEKSENLLAKARDVMRRDLHDSVHYQTLELQKLEMKSISGVDDTERILSKNLFQFPSCQISKSVQEIVYLLSDILDEACKSSDDHALKLFYTTRNILEMYAGLVPLVHKSYLETIPHQVALFHNNCWYLAHQILTLILKYKPKLPPAVRKRLLLYCDQSVLLREVGTEHFLNHMKYQRDMIYDILRNSGLAMIGQASELPPSVERSLRQCIRQLELLHKVWIEILPENVYSRSVGTIVGDMLDDLVCKIVAVEDISVSIATELVSLFGMVTKRLPQIFPQSNCIEKYVRTWLKLKELIIVLGASLKDIEERWADGKGPLANEFSAQRVKQLIRALFQNTERRSNLLSKIRDN